MICNFDVGKEAISHGFKLRQNVNEWGFVSMILRGYCESLASFLIQLSGRVLLFGSRDPICGS